MLPDAMKELSRDSEKQLLIEGHALESLKWYGFMFMSVTCTLSSSIMSVHLRKIVNQTYSSLHHDMLKFLFEGEMFRLFIRGQQRCVQC